MKTVRVFKEIVYYDAKKNMFLLMYDECWEFVRDGKKQGWLIRLGEL